MPSHVTRDRPASSLMSADGRDSDCVTRCKLRGSWRGGGMHKQTLAKNAHRVVFLPYFPFAFSCRASSCRRTQQPRDEPRAHTHPRRQDIFSAALGSASANLLRMGLAVQYTHTYVHTRAPATQEQAPRTLQHALVVSGS